MDVCRPHRLTASDAGKLRGRGALSRARPPAASGPCRLLPPRPAKGHAKCSASKRNGDEEVESISVEEPTRRGVPQELQFGSALPAASGPKGSRQVQMQQELLSPGDEIGGGKYKVLGVIGTGGNAVTYKAVNSDGVEVAVKTLSLRGLKDWKKLELFEREAATLRELSHPGIPKYLDYFEDDTENDRAFFLVQELAPGKSLGELVAEGKYFTEDSIASIARQLLEILSYLSSLRPSVVHRDVKPDNIILDGETIRLVDFGGVQEASLWGDGMPLGSTIVGTYGYMAPEQFRGAAQPSSDLYALGGTLLFLLSGLPPSAFPQERLRIDFESRIEAGEKMRTLLAGLLEPLPEDRLTAKQALDILAGKRKPEKPTRRDKPQQPMEIGRERPRALRKPVGSRVTVSKEGKTTIIEIPPAPLGPDALGTGAFAVTWNLFVGYWTAGALIGGGLLFAAFSAPFWVAGVQLLRSSFGSFLSKSKLIIAPGAWSITKELALLKGGVPTWAGGGEGNTVYGDTSDLEAANVSINGYINGDPQTDLILYEGIKKHSFGEGLEFQEQEWLAAVINDAIARAKEGGELGGIEDDDDDYEEDLR